MPTRIRGKLTVHGCGGVHLSNVDVEGDIEVSAHDHHCQCDRCCVARRASIHVRKEVPLSLLVAACVGIWGTVALIAAALMEFVL